jgi:hypothetical protein
MPWFRRNSATHPTNPLDWVTIANVYRKNSDGPWVKIRRIYRKNSNTAGGNWVIVHDSDSLKPFYTVPPTLESNAYSPSIFLDGSTLTLTRGTWSNTGDSYAPVSYSLKIQASADQSTWTDVATGTGTTLTYLITLSDVIFPSYYFRGRVEATNVNGSTVAIVGITRSQMDLSVTSVNAYVANNQIFADWTFNKTNNSSNIASQQVNVRTNVSYTYNGNFYNAYSIVHSFSVSPGTSFTSFGISGTNIKPSTSIYIEVVATANDSAGTQESNYSADFISPMVVGTVSITPSFSLLGGYKRIESGSTVTAVPDGWPSGTTFVYNWYRTRSFVPADELSLGTGSSITITATPSVTGERVWVEIYGTYEGQTSSAVFSEDYRIIPQPPTFTLSSIAGGFRISNVAAVGGEDYIGSYESFNPQTSQIEISPIPVTSIGANRDITGLVGGRQYTVYLYSEATNGSGASLITIQSRIATTSSITVTNFNGATSTSINNVSRYDNDEITAVINFLGATGPYYQLYWTTANVAPTTSVYDAASTNSTQISDTFTASANQTYYFYVRSSTINRGDTTTGGLESDSATYSAYGPVSPQPIASYTFTNPSGGSASINGGTAVGSTLTLSRTDATGNPSPTGITWLWRRADGGVGANSFSGGTILQSGGTTYTTTSSDSGYQVRAEVNWNNGVGTQTVNTNSITVTATRTVTWNAQGGSGGGSTTQNAGVAHTAPSPGTRSGFTFNGYYDTPSGDFLYGPIQSGGSFTPPSNITMYARWSTVPTTPSVPGTPTLNYLSSGSTVWFYSASWGASSGTGTIQYQVLGEGDLGGSAFRPSSSPYFTTNSGNFSFPKSGGTNWRIRVRATNDNGATWSGYSGYSNYA